MSFWKKHTIVATAAAGGAAGAALCTVTSPFVGATKGAVADAVTRLKEILG